MAERATVRLDEDELWAFLEQGHTGILTSLQRDGTPVALPVWYVVLERAVYVSGPAHTKKWKRIGRDPRVSFLVEEGLDWRELQAVHLSGTAHFVEDPGTTETVAELLDGKYEAFRTARKTMPEPAQRTYAGASRLIRIDPHRRTLSWNNAKLPLG